jgi:hypothetical protein
MTASGVASEEDSKRVFYCGTVSYISTEMGHYSFDENIKGGGSQKTTKGVNTEIKGQWSICMECGFSFGGMVMASGESIGSIKYQHSREEYY